MIIKNIDVLGDEIFWVDDVVPEPLLQKWWIDVINFGKWDKGFLAYGGNPPHPSMDRTGDPQTQKIIREQGSFSKNGRSQVIKDVRSVNVNYKNLTNSATTISTTVVLIAGQTTGANGSVVIQNNSKGQFA